MLNKFIMVRA